MIANVKFKIQLAEIIVFTEATVLKATNRTLVRCSLHRIIKHVIAFVRIHEETRIIAYFPKCQSGQVCYIQTFATLHNTYAAITLLLQTSMPTSNLYSQPHETCQQIE